VSKKPTHLWEVTLKDGTVVRVVGNSLRKEVWVSWVKRPLVTKESGGVRMPGKVLLALAKVFAG
jgi:hypothetical protein